MRGQLVQNNEKYFMYVNTGIKFDQKHNTSRSLNIFDVIKSGHKTKKFGKITLFETLNLQHVSSLKIPSPSYNSSVEDRERG